jgi:AbrB family looped-hinge helix DNA binding protein
MQKENTTIISNHGRITIPATIRKKMGLRDGMEVLVLEDEGDLKIIPILSDEEIRKMALPANEVERIYRESKAEELELDDK